MGSICNGFVRNKLRRNNPVLLTVDFSCVILVSNAVLMVVARWALFARSPDGVGAAFLFVLWRRKTTAYLRTAGYPITSGPNISDGVSFSISVIKFPVKARSTPSNAIQDVLYFASCNCSNAKWTQNPSKSSRKNCRTNSKDAAVSVRY